MESGLIVKPFGACHPKTQGLNKKHSAVVLMLILCLCVVWDGFVTVCGVGGVGKGEGEGRDVWSRGRVVQLCEVCACCLWRVCVLDVV